MRQTIKRGALSAVVLLALAVASAPAQERLLITVENLSPTEGFFLTPTWIGLHNGSFDLFDVGATASTGLEQLAEDGIIGPASDPSTLSGMFAAPGRLEGVATGPSGFGSQMGQPPLIDTGETASVEIQTINPAAYRYLSFASMVIPSNDAFIGNEKPDGVRDLRRGRRLQRRAGHRRDRFGHLGLRHRGERHARRGVLDDRRHVLRRGRHGSTPRGPCELRGNRHAGRHNRGRPRARFDDSGRADHG